MPEPGINQAIRDLFGPAPQYMPAGAGVDRRFRYSEALMTELLNLLVNKEVISEAEAKGVIHRARERVSVNRG